MGDSNYASPLSKIGKPGEQSSPKTGLEYLKEISDSLKKVKTNFGLENVEKYNSSGKVRLFFAILLFILFFAPFSYWCYNVYKINNLEIIEKGNTMGNLIELVEDIKYLFIAFQAAMLAGFLVLIVNTFY